jgi:hypothetical protein
MRRDTQEGDMTADDAWGDLSASLEDSEPLCNGLELFTADRLPDEDRAWCASICALCPVTDLCDAYATAAKVTAGFWAGHFYTSKGKT